MKGKIWRTSLFRRGLTLVEMLVVLLIFGVVSTVIYQVFRNFLRSHIKIGDRIENVTEGWQIVRVVSEDLICCDYIDGDSTKCDDTLAAIGSLIIFRRKGDKIVRIDYKFDEATGNISRIEEGRGTVSLIQGRCTGFTISSTKEPNICFKVKIELKNMAGVREPGRLPDQAQPVEIETNVFPPFLNLKVRKKYIHNGLPN